MSNRSERISRILRLKAREEDNAASIESERAMQQRRAKRDRRRHETSSHQVSSNRSSATIGELLEQDAILAATANALSAARSAEIACATEADIARAVRERHTQRRKSLEKAHLRIIKIEAEQRAAQQIREIQELSLQRSLREETE
jgi:hypothetical protein